jgi:hypothetical protein
VGVLAACAVPMSAPSIDPHNARREMNGRQRRMALSFQP